MKRPFLLLVLPLCSALLFNISAVPAADDNTAASIAPAATAPPGAPPSEAKRIRIEVVDRTEGKSLRPEQIREIENEVRTKILALSPAVEIAQADGEKVAGVLRGNMEVFTAGNRGLRLWVGFGAGSARLKFTAQWLEGTGQEPADSKDYQRFGPGSMKSGGEIETQMAGLVGDYCKEFVAPHLK